MIGFHILKRIIDIVVSVSTLIILFPLIIWIVWKIKNGSKGPAFFTQIRVGQNKREFRFYKFRTMIENAEQLLPQYKHLNEVDGPVFKITHDPRLTKFGRWMRAKNLDELPQLWNVIKGDMSLVGFRPPTPSETKQYKKWHMKRFESKPGITSLWAVKGGHSISFDKWVEMDLWYAEHESLSPYLKILFVTVWDIVDRMVTRDKYQNHYITSDIKIGEFPNNLRK